jgi:predicted transcriptional regulator
MNGAFDTLMVIDPLEQVCSLYFELSNLDRLKVLQEISQAPKKLTEISGAIDTTHQQCLRHLRRLTKMQLVNRNNEGSYKMTLFGELVLQLTPGLTFISKHRDYFNSHSLAQIPPEFVARIGELSESTLIPNVMQVISEIEAIVKNTEDHLNVIINKRTHSIRPYIAEAIRRGIKLNSISITSYVPTIDVKREINIRDELDIINAEKNGTTKVADQTNFSVYLYQSEKTMFISFPLQNGTFDYNGFHSSNQEAIKYCDELFKHFWSKTNIISASEIVDRHIKYLEYYGYNSKRNQSLKLHDGKAP